MGDGFVGGFITLLGLEAMISGDTTGLTLIISVPLLVDSLPEDPGVFAGVPGLALCIAEPGLARPGLILSTPGLLLGIPGLLFCNPGLPGNPGLMFDSGIPGLALGSAGLVLGAPGLVLDIPGLGIPGLVLA